MLTEHDTPDSPDWWLLRLGRRLRARQGKLRVWRDYYRGHHPLPQGPKKATEAYRDFQKKARTNFMQLVVDASVDRLRVTGITDSQGRPDADANAWWQQNRLDARQILVYRTALALSEAYVIVGPHPADARRPLITVEHPSEVIVEHDPATRERRAALKAWYDDVAGRARANVWLPGRLIKYETERRGPGPLPWGPGAWTRTDDSTHQFGVPVVP
ncbi:MAG TPA: phage portal protein, partial [Micromonosporaceae bacterium]